jgi:hypothetical protein
MVNGEAARLQIILANVLGRRTGHAKRVAASPSLRHERTLFGTPGSTTGWEAWTPWR